VRGRNAAGRAEACSRPIAPGLTPHGLRHTHKTLMDGLGTPAKLADERMGHEDGSVQARYSHVTAAMRTQLLDGLTGLWHAALDARRALSARSPWPRWTGCSRSAPGRRENEPLKIFSRDSPDGPPETSSGPVPLPGNLP
jgi:hypothetical protein